MNDFGNALFVSGSPTVRHINACADRKSQKKIYDEVDECSGRAYRRQRRVSFNGNSAHNDGVRGIEKKLKESGRHYRQCVQYNAFCKRPFTDVRLGEKASQNFFVFINSKHK